MKVLYFGSDVFLSCFDYFLREHEILALYTYHRDEDYFSEYAITAKANALGIPVHYDSVTPAQITRYFLEDGCALLFIAEYDRVVSIPADLPCFRGINIHSSLLPQGRSYYPIEAAMTRGLADGGVTMHKLTAALDQGDILARRKFPIRSDMDSIDVYLTCAVYAREMLEEFFRDPERAWNEARPQQALLPYWKRPSDTVLTLRPDMTRAQACAVFRDCNRMTQVQLRGTWYYVTALQAGVAPLPDGIRFLAPERVLYPVKDGHLRLHILPIQEVLP